MHLLRDGLPDPGLLGWAGGGRAGPTASEAAMNLVLAFVAGANTGLAFAWWRTRGGDS